MPASQVLLAGCATFVLALALVGPLWQRLTWLHEPRWENPVADMLGKVVCWQEADGTRTCVAENGAISVLACAYEFAKPAPSAAPPSGNPTPAP